MRDRWQPILGGLLVIVGVVLLFVSPKQFNVFHLLAFISCWTVGGLLLMGLIGTHPEAARLRRLADEGGRPEPSLRPEIAARTFRYGRADWRRAAAAGFCLLAGMAFVVWGGVVLFIMPWTDLAALIVLSSGSSLWGGFLCYYGYRYLRVRIDVSPEGIHAVLYFRGVVMRWDEVVALVTKRVSMPMIATTTTCTTGAMVDAGRMYWVYSRQGKLWFSGAINGAAELADLIRSATGLEWQQG